MKKLKGNVITYARRDEPVEEPEAGLGDIDSILDAPAEEEEQ